MTTLYDTIPPVGAPGPGWATDVVTVLQGILTTGTWAEMQDEDPVEGRGFSTTDQGLHYRGDGTAWRRFNGDPNETWATDYGAVPTGPTPPSGAVRTANRAAIQAAVDDVEAIVISGTYLGPNCEVKLNATSAGAYYYTDDDISTYIASLIGSGSAGGSQFSRNRNKGVLWNTTAGGRALTMDTSGGASIGINATHRNLVFAGDEQGAWVKNRAVFGFEHCDFYYTYHAGHADNAALVLENAFLFTVEKFGTYESSGTTPTTWDTRGPCSILIIASDGGEIDGIGEATFRNGVLSLGGIRLENRTTVQLGDSATVLWDDVLTEGSGPQAMFQFVTTTGTAPHVATGWEFRRVERADAADVGTAADKSRAMFVIDGMALHNSQFWNCNPYASYLIRVQNGGQCFGNTGNSSGSSGLTFDPAHNEATNAHGTVTFKLGINVDLYDTEAFDPLYTVTDPLSKTSGEGISVTASQAEARKRWNVGARGQQLWGDGTNPGDVFLYRAGTGILGVRSVGANAAALVVDNVDSSQDSGVQLRRTGSTQWRIYNPGSSTELRFAAGGSTTRLTLTNDGGMKLSSATPTPAAGMIWFDGTEFKARDASGTTKTVSLV